MIQKPDFRDLKKLINAVNDTNNAIKGIYSDKESQEAEEAAANLDKFAVYMNGEKIIRNTARWIFSGKELKEHTLDVVDDIYAFCDSPFFERLLHFLDLYRDASSVPADEALNRFGQNSADYYALLEKLGKNRGNKPFIYDSIPDQLASEVEATEPDLSDFKGNLRAYQTFGIV